MHGINLSHCGTFEQIKYKINNKCLLQAFLNVYRLDLMTNFWYDENYQLQKIKLLSAPAIYPKYQAQRKFKTSCNISVCIDWKPNKGLICFWGNRRALHGVGAGLLKWGWESLLSLILSTNHCLLCQKYIWQQSLEHKEWEKPLVDHLYPVFLCVNTASFLLVYLSIWAGIQGNGAGIHLQWAKKNTDFVSEL